VTSELIIRSLREAAMTMLAAIATMLCALAIDPEPGPTVMAVVLSLVLSRSHLDLDVKGRVDAAIALPLVSLAALAVAALMHHFPWLGALAFVAGMSVSIWLRRFGPLVRRAASLIALPFVVILTTPYIPTTRASPLLALFVPVIVAELALLWVSAVHLLGRRWGWLPPARARKIAAAETPNAGAMRPVASTRMAIQMAVALSIAFIVGFVFFAERWAWLVLTAYIVGSGNQGRLDVAYKSVLRVLGAAAGTVLALGFAFHVGSHDATTVVLILAAVFLGVWLRPLGYAWWALFVTLALSLLQGFQGPSAQQMLGLRVEEIVIGAIIGVAAAWFVLPVRSTDVMRRRVADVLALLADAFDPATPARESDQFFAAIERMQKVAPAFRASRLLTRRYRSIQPADWVDALLACREPAASLIATGETPGAVRKAITAARKAMREPAEIQPALDDLRRVLGRQETASAGLMAVTD
jgi:hypothetical protein